MTWKILHVEVDRFLVVNNIRIKVLNSFKTTKKHIFPLNNSHSCICMYEDDDTIKKRQCRLNSSVQEIKF
jgi:hypothetical protein